jgi:hypothetical protein
LTANGLLASCLRRKTSKIGAGFLFSGSRYMADFYAVVSGPSMRVRIVRALDAHEFGPFDVSRFQVGGVYQVGIKLGELLIVGGYAHPDRRTRHLRVEAADHPRRRKTDRR